MAPHASMPQRARLAQEARRLFLTEVGRTLAELGSAVQARLSGLIDEPAAVREMQARRDAWTQFQAVRKPWIEGLRSDWQEALTLAVPDPKGQPELSLELLGTDVVENKIIASRMALTVMEKSSSDLNDLRLRIKELEGKDGFEGKDILRPEVLLQTVIERWIKAGMAREHWSMVHETAVQFFTHHLKRAYADCNAWLISQGVLPTIELVNKVRRTATAPARGAAPGSAAAEVPQSPQSSGDAGSGSGAGGMGGGDAQPQPGSAARSGVFGGRLGWGRETGAHSGPSTGGLGGRSGHPPMQHHTSGYGTADETRMMTSATPLARARSRAMGVMGQLKRLWSGAVGTHFEATQFQPPSPALAAAIAVGNDPMVGTGSATLVEDYSPAGVARVATELRRRTSDLKEKAETKNEKATIEIVALMFQAILQEERIPPAIRVWFARLQMPVLRVALAEPDFFGTLDHPARQLIDRMGSCVMGFDASGIQGSALETEIKRVVQVIEQYPETGKRVYQLVFEEFQKFLAQFLAGGVAAQKVVSVAQQVEQKETLTIQYTIEMRNMLKDVPVRDEIRQFLFKVWAEVLAVAAVRKGPKHAETLELKKLAADLVWSASAKPNRADRARVIQDLPKLLQKLRTGMTLLGVAPSEQDVHVKSVSDILAQAFLSKTQSVTDDQIAAMAQRLEHLEDYVSDDGMGDLPLDAQSIEVMLGIDAATIDVVADGGSQPTAAMISWSQELQLGSWFTLDHNGRVAQVQFVWRSERKHLNLFTANDGHSYLVQARRLAAYLQAGLLVPQEEETLTVRATREALDKIKANPERLLQ